MSVAERLRRLFGGRPRIAVRVMIRGRIGEGWQDVDETIALPEGATLADLLDVAERRAVPLRAALEQSPHLRETMMVNGSRCRVDDHLDRVMRDGDEVYLLAPVAGG